MKKKCVNIALLIAGVLLIVGSLVFLKNDAVRTLSGICFGIGAGTIGVCTSNLLMISWYKKHPEALKQADIEAKDERNEVIRNRAKAKGGDILQWAVMAAAWVAIFADFPIWMVLLLVGIFALKSVLDIVYMSKYSKEM